MELKYRVRSLPSLFSAFMLSLFCSCAPLHSLSDQSSDELSNTTEWTLKDSRPKITTGGGQLEALSSRPTSHMLQAIEADNTDSLDTSSDVYQRGMLAQGVSWIPQLSRYAILYYLPNRFMDLIDIFRFDIGFGVSYGAVARFTPHGQFGYRGFSTPSFRIGPHGRYVPYFTERYDEYGFGPWFKSNRPRTLSMTPAEVAVSADVGLLGVYAGISFDEALDFVLGILLIDYKGDDTIR